MNDFTKAELKFIAIALERFAVKDSELDKKIHSLIDNYCEHERCRNKNCRLSAHSSIVECME